MKKKEAKKWAAAVSDHEITSSYLEYSSRFKVASARLMDGSGSAAKLAAARMMMSVCEVEMGRRGLKV